MAVMDAKRCNVKIVQQLIIFMFSHTVYAEFRANTIDQYIVCLICARCSWTNNTQNAYAFIDNKVHMKINVTKSYHGSWGEI